MSSEPVCGYVSLLYSVADKPLELWSKHVSLGGKIRRVSDDMLHGDKVIEIVGPHDSVVSTSITAPAKVANTLNVGLAVLVLIIKNLKSRFKLEVQITDKKQYRRRFSFMTYNLEKLPIVNANVARIPLKLEDCWNSLEINLQTLCRTAYGTDYEALQRMTIYPNCRLRRVYLQDRHYNHDETPIELCNAFFDTYMSKWGINFIEKTCQTEEYYTGFSKEHNSHSSASDNKTTVSSAKADLSKDNADKSGSSNVLGANSHPEAPKKHYTSSGNFSDKAKMRDNRYAVKPRNWSHVESLMSETLANKLKKISNNVTQTQRNNEITRENVNSFAKLDKRTRYPASSVEASQFLKVHVDKTLFQNNSRNGPKFPKRLHPYRIEDLENAQKNNSMSNTKFGISIINFPLTSKPNLSENIKLTYDQMENMIVFKDISAKKSEKMNARPSSTNLTKNKTTFDLMSARNLVNRRFFEKLQDKGLVRSQVKLPA